MNKINALALLLSVAPVAAQAELITGGLTLSFTDHSEAGDTIKTVGLDGRLNVDMDNGLTFGVDLGRANMSLEGTPVDLYGEFMSFSAGYRFGNGFKAGLFMDHLTLGVEIGPSALEATLKTKGLSLGYEGSNFEVEAFVGRSEVAALIVLPIDIDNIGITGHYTGIQGLDIGATFSRARISLGGPTEDIDFKGVAATYMVNDKLMVFGGVTALDILGSVGIDSFGLGVSYDLGANLGFASSVSLEAGQTSLGPIDIDVIRVAWTIPLGKKGPVLPMNSVADAVLNARHGALNAGLTAGF